VYRLIISYIVCTDMAGYREDLRPVKGVDSHEDIKCLFKDFISSRLTVQQQKVHYFQDLCRQSPLVTGVRIAFASRKCVAHKVLRKWFPPPILFPRNFE